MSPNEALLDRVRAELDNVSNVEEKRMFGGILFMVNDKMCVSVGATRLMCRIDPDRYDAALAMPGVHPMIMRGREYRGYVHVDATSVKADSDLRYWINLALEYNPKAEASKRSKKKRKSASL